MSRHITDDESLLAQNLRAAHRRLVTRRGKASLYKCVDCNEPAMDWSRRHEETGFDSSHYDPRCRSCHQLYDYTDERREKISKANKGRSNWLGRKHSEATKAKMAEARRQWWAND